MMWVCTCVCGNECLSCLASFYTTDNAEKQNTGTAGGQEQRQCESLSVNVNVHVCVCVCLCVRVCTYSSCMCVCVCVRVCTYIVGTHTPHTGALKNVVDTFLISSFLTVLHCKSRHQVHCEVSV